MSVLSWSELPAAAQDPFEVGVEMTRQGRYDQALRWFRTAQQQGDDSGRLHFNLGVVHYRLGALAAARDAFERAARDPEMRDLAQYNLGLVALAGGDTVQAERWFARTLEQAADPALRRLASRALGASESRAPRLSTGLQVLRGHDSNVIIPVGTISDAPTRSSDHYWDLRGGVAGGFGGATSRWGWYASGLLHTYDDLDDGDLGAAEAGLQWRGPLELELGAGVLTVGDRGYQRSVELRAQTTVWEGDDGAIDVLAQATRLDALDDAVQRLDGYQFGLGLGYEQRWDPFKVSGRYRHLENDRQDATLSPPQDLVELRTQWAWQDLRLRAWGRFVDSRYPAGRRDRARDFGVSAGLALGACCELLVEWNHQENDSTESIFSYVSRRLAAGLRLQF